MIDRFPVLTEAPTDYPVTLDEVKLHLKVDHSSEDDLISAQIGACVEQLQTELEQQLMTGTFELKLPGFWWPCIELTPSPVLDPDSVAITYLDQDQQTQTLNAGLYNVVTSTRPARIERAWNAVWPVTYWHPEAVTVTYDAGYGGSDEVPLHLKQALLLMLGHWYTHRMSVSDAGKIPAMEIPGCSSIVQGARTYRF